MALPRHACGRAACPKEALKRTYMLASLRTGFDPDVWSGRASQERFVELEVKGLASMYPAFRLELLLRATMDISAPAISLTDRPQGAIRVTSYRKRREDRTSISSHPLADLGWNLLMGLRHRLLLLPRSSCVRARGRSFVPARRTCVASRARAVKAGRCALLAAGSGVARPRLDRAEHGARIKRVGRLHRWSLSARRRVL